MAKKDKYGASETFLERQGRIQALTINQARASVRLFVEFNASARSERGKYGTKSQVDEVTGTPRLGRLDIFIQLYSRHDLGHQWGQTLR